MRHGGASRALAAARGLCAGLCLWLSLGLSSLPASAQGTDATTTTTQPPAGTVPADAAVPSELDYPAWESIAAQAEVVLADSAATTTDLEEVRAELAGWREALLLAQNTNAARIATLREQIDALGPAPEKDQTEAPELADRRATLSGQLTRLQAPGIAADEAYRRADGLIREIDRVIRDRKASALLQLLPSPVNPANWGEAAKALGAALVSVTGEARTRLALPSARDAMVNKLPAIALLLVLAIALIWRGRRVVEQVVGRIAARTGLRGRRIAMFVVSLGQIIIPVAGVYALSHALRLTGLLGITGTGVAEALPAIGLVIFVAAWLGGRLFPPEGGFASLALSTESRAEARFVIVLYGIMLGLDALRRAIMAHQDMSDAARSVLTFPTLLVTGILLFRMGRLMQAHAASGVSVTDEAVRFRITIISLLGKAAVVVGVVGPLLAAVGYVSAAAAILVPTATSLGLIGALAILQRLTTDVYALVARNEEAGQKALGPVLIGFVLVLLSLPVFALVWGARLADLTEVWTRLREGFVIGTTRISPTNFLVFALVFGFGYMLTRLLQGALKGTVLPRTQLDQGARNALVSGLGYLGIFLAALIAINAAGIDLSSLAIVAGALSVGIGFGLQNVVSNFVSGIILLIERPVSEGDWIEVGGVQGTVKAISVRSTRIQTFDRTDVIVPNTDLVAGQVTNWTRYNLSGRLIVPVGVAFGTDTRLVERVLREIAEAQPLAVLNPPPLIAFMGFGADSMNFEIRVILRDVNFSVAVRSEINHQIVARFAHEGIEIPFAQSEITLRNAGDIADLVSQLMQTAGAAGGARPEVQSAPAAARRTPRKGPPKGPQRDVVPGEGLLPEGPRDDDADGPRGGET